MDIVARRYDTRELVCVRIEAGRIQSIQPAASPARSDDAPWLAPGLVDLQVNGHGGRDFLAPEATIEDVAGISAALASQGATRYYPTLTTHSHERLAQALRTISKACAADAGLAAQIGGIHLEGPFISPEDGPRGAHPRQHVRPPDWAEFQRLQEAAGGRIRIVTLSPEYDAAADFVARVAGVGILVAIGHTKADSDQIRAAVDAGARLSTHLGNGAHGQIRRHPNYIWDQLAEDRLTASLIGDGHHLPAAVVKTFVRAKTPQRCILVSDLTSMAGQPPGRYETDSLGAVEILDDGRLVLAGQRQFLAGAALPITVGVVNVMRFAGLDLQAAVDMASVRPAALMGGEAAGLAVDAPADLLLFRLPGADGAGRLEPLEVIATILGGQVIFATAAFMHARHESR
jgi:N-acetylglucosamine-6-phosphate deacetylase